jgi:WD40 repeat protein
VSHYPTDYADLHFPKSDEVPDAWGRRLGLSILRGQFVIHQVQLTERSGQGIVYRHAPRDPRLLWAARAGLARPYAVHFLAGGAGQAVLAASSSPQQNRNTFTAWSETGQRITRLDGWWAVPAPKGQIVHVSGGGRLNLTYPLEPAATDSKELGLASSAVIGSFLPDGSRIAVVGKSDQSAVQVLENESGAELARLTLPGVSWIGFSPDGRYLAAMGNHLGQRVIAVWNADVAGETNEPLWRVEVPARSRSEPSHEASQPLVGGFSSSGRWLLARSGNTVLLFPTDAAQHRKSATPTSQSADRRELVLSQEVTGARFTRDDRYLVISCADPAKGLQLWDVETATEIQRFKSPQGPVRAMEVTTDGTRVAAGSDDGFVRLFALDSGQELTRFTGHDAPVTGLAISADDKTIVSGSEDGLIRVFSLAK